MNKAKYKNEELPTAADVSLFEMLFPMLKSDVSEIRELSKKKQDEPLNLVKVRIINKKLGQVKELLKNQPTNQYLELLDEDTIPTNSDAVLMISQFINALEQFEKKYYESDGADIDILGSRWTWKIKE